MADFIENQKTFVVHFLWPFQQKQPFPLFLHHIIDCNGREKETFIIVIRHFLNWLK